MRRPFGAIARSAWARALVSAGLLALVLTQIDLSQAGERLSGGRWGLFSAAAAIDFVSFLLAAWRWHLYLRAAGLESSPATAIRAYLVGTFANTFLPSQVGGDVARAFLASGSGPRLRAATTVVVDRATALACLIAVGWIAAAASPGEVPGELWAALGAATGVAGVGMAGAAFLVGSRRAARLVPARLRGPRREIAQAARACARKKVLAQTLVAGLAFQGLILLAAWLLVRAISLDLALPALAASLAPVLIVSLLPVSLGGLGVREGSYVVLLGYAGLAPADATVFSLLGAASFLLASLPGAVALVVRPRAASPAGEGRSAAEGTR